MEKKNWNTVEGKELKTKLKILNEYLQNQKFVTSVVSDFVLVTSLGRMV